MLPLWARFLAYGIAGVTFEILFTGIKHLKSSHFQDWSLTGKSYIWMFPVYGLAAFLFEPVHDAVRTLIWPLRGLLYVIGFYVVEFITGWLLKLLTGKCPWDYSGKKYNFRGFIRWDYAPLWFLFCLMLEKLHDLLLRVRIL